MTQKTSIAPWLEYKPGKKDIHGSVIKSIYTITNNVALYGTETDDLNWEYRGPQCPNADKALSLAQALVTRVDSQLPKGKRDAAKGLIYGGLGLAIETKKNENVGPYFQEAEQYIESSLSESLHLRFVATAIVASALFATPAVTYYFLVGKDNLYQFLVAGALGACGALVSLLQRFSSIPIPKYSSWRFVVVRAISRVLLGVIFAFVLMIFQRAGLVLNLLAGNSLLVYSFAFISGLSERLVPELVDQLETNVLSGQRKNA